MEDRSRTFNYIDKKGRLIPYIDNLIDECKPTGKNPNSSNFYLLIDMKKRILDGVFDWQPSE